MVRARQASDPMVVGIVIWPWSALLAIRAPRHVIWAQEMFSIGVRNGKYLWGPKNRSFLGSAREGCANVCLHRRRIHEVRVHSRLGLYPIATSQYSSTTLSQISYHISTCYAKVAIGYSPALASSVACARDPGPPTMLCTLLSGPEAYSLT